MAHALERTSPKGEPFVGTCLKCGIQNLTPRQLFDDCDSDITDEEALVQILESKNDSPL